MSSNRVVEVGVRNRGRGRRALANSGAARGARLLSRRSHGPWAQNLVGEEQTAIVHTLLSGTVKVCHELLVDEEEEEEEEQGR